MRYHKPSKRTLALITDPAIPRRADGHVRLCPSCQRRTFFAGGFVEMLSHDLELLGRLHWVREAARKRCEEQQARLRKG